ncbi:hypothetical protein AM10699_28860 [Acaryochloris marina MBIC10699]|nr:hypothetical protein AM10699_28860 [Acaryochloris marina MBIC10699]
MLAQAEVGEWAATASGLCPHWAVEDALFVATDEGIIRIQVEQGRLIVQRRFPETEPFVQTGCQLLAAPRDSIRSGPKQFSYCSYRSV